MDRKIIKDEFKDGEEIDTDEQLKHDSDKKDRPRKEMKEKNGKVQIWVKKETLEYEKQLTLFQIELLKLQNHIKETGEKILMLFEGRDAAGKGGTIKRITEHLNPRGARVVALEKPSDTEKTQWYFQRYIAHLPSAGEIVIFDRSWYNRGGVEPVMGFCTPEEHHEFLREVPEFEKMLVKSGIKLFKFYFSVSKKEQEKRFNERKLDPLKQFKLSPVDELAQTLWDKYTVAKYSMMMASNTDLTPWTVVRSDDKKKARIETMKFILRHLEYNKKNKNLHLKKDKEIIISGTEEIILMEQENTFKKGN
ncbi:MAG: polyphosphate kinase 2 [Arcobacteraceae bacterium]|nr:polyphosphate kinase 2 [Arcobacteraceae bacterium]